MQDAIYAPHWNQNAHSVIYVLRGRAQVQVVDDFGQTVLDDELQQEQGPDFSPFKISLTMPNFSPFYENWGLCQISSPLFYSHMPILTIKW